MSSGRIIETRAQLLGIELEKPFPLGFGTLSHLPRVLFQIRASENKEIIEGIGEASIDFPFSRYDAFDIYHALSRLHLVDRDLNDRENILASSEIRNSLLLETPAAFTALNMALDDICGKVQGKNLMDFYGRKRLKGKALASIAFQAETSLLVKEAQEKFNEGYIPKPKVGKSIEEDVHTLSALDGISLKDNFKYVLDFNGQYSIDDMRKLLVKLQQKGVLLNQVLFVEQPTHEADGVDALAAFREIFADAMGREVSVIADESFVTLADAIACRKAGIDLNFKIHKVGGLYYAREIEKLLQQMNLLSDGSMVGGTFPTALGRIYDQQSASVLESATMPGDGMEPSTDWFKGKKHFIVEQFEQQDSQGNFKPKTGPGLGITPNWQKIKMFTIEDPLGEYRKIRSGMPGESITIQLKDGQSYKMVYERKSGKSADWNL